MRKRNSQRSYGLGLMGATTAAGLMMLASCSDNLTGQDGEPHGQLKVTRLTLNDESNSRNASPTATQVVTDTSVPPDCMAASAMSLPQCTNDPFKDKYGVLKSPPNPDSASSLRVVFNKVPLKLSGMDLEPIPMDDLPLVLPTLTDPTVLTLTCQNCSTDSSGAMGVPTTYNSLQITGTDLSPDPGQYAYGPSLEMEVITGGLPVCGPKVKGKCTVSGIDADPFNALEPGSTYAVVLKPGLSGRIGDGTDSVLLDDAAKALLTFTTEPLQPLFAGINAIDPLALAQDGTTLLADNTLFGTTMNGDGSAAMPYTAAAIAFDTMMMPLPDPQLVANEGAIAVTMNAPIDETLFVDGQTATATVTVGGVASPVAVIVSTALMPDPNTMPPPKCDYGNRRQVYIAPSSGTWTMTPQANVTVDVTLRGSDIRDLSQIPGHPAGKGVHVLGKDIHVHATLMATAAPVGYPGKLATQVLLPSKCK